MGTTTVGTSSAKNLGVTFDESMTFSNHVTDVARRCTGILSGLSHSRHYLPKSTLATLVQALVVSSIRYAIVVYGGCGVTQMSRLQRLINFGARVVSGKRKYDHVSEVLKELRWLSAENMWRLQSVTLLKKILETGEPEALSNAIVSRGSVHGRDTRQADLLDLPVIRTESGRRRFLYATVSQYNALPPALRNLGHRLAHCPNRR